MGRRLFYMLIALCLLVFHTRAIFAEENFLLIDGITNETVLKLGSHVEERISPCSTFKITLSLMGYDTGILIDEVTPSWDFHEGYNDCLPSWRAPITPKSWLEYSCVWYSKVLSLRLGLEKIQSYLTSMEYGNRDMSGGLAEPGPMDPTWINSSLKISPKEQVDFIQKMILGKLPISTHAIQMTKALLFKEESPEGWKLFGKTGWSGSDTGWDGKTLEHGWFVGWLEKDHHFFPFAYLICEQKIDLGERIPRVKQLLEEANVMSGAWDN